MPEQSTGQELGFHRGRSVKTSWTYLAIAASLMGLLTCVLLYKSRSRQKASTGLERILLAQRELPPQAVAALQDLRLAAAVELSYFSSRGRYGTADELKFIGYLSPRWPRSDAKAYRVSCTIEAGRAGFVCYADPQPADGIAFRVDASQAVRFERGRRPDVNSPIFGLSKEVR